VPTSPVLKKLSANSKAFGAKRQRTYEFSIKSNALLKIMNICRTFPKPRPIKLYHLNRILISCPSSFKDIPQDFFKNCQISLPMQILGRRKSSLLVVGSSRYIVPGVVVYYYFQEVSSLPKYIGNRYDLKDTARDCATERGLTRQLKKKIYYQALHSMSIPRAFECYYFKIILNW
jgi:hypothetical protein